MYSKLSALALLVAFAQARFGQEQVPIPAIAAVNGGAPGVAPTIAGAAVSDLLAATNACAKLSRGDQILAELGNGADAIAAAIGMVGAEKNFNPFNQDVPTICSDPTLPTNPVLRGITPKVDPAVPDAAVANNLAAQTAQTPLNADGKSVADLLKENGYTNFISQDSSGATVQPAAGAGDSANNSTSNDSASNGSASTSTTTSAASSATDGCTGGSAGSDSGNTGSTGSDNSNAGSGTNTTTTVGGGVDFGLCTPTMSFEAGRPGRKATEFTFLPIDPLCAQGQQDALNPNIITNRICDQLTNVCKSNQAAKDLCRSAQTQIQALGTRDKSTADKWNSLLGFAGAVTNPDGGPAEPSATATAAARRMVRRSFQA